ncbi:cytochrome c family protein [Parasphingorhabdus sp. JC815]|uniref:c-type cytochrome n=1 Tax=Parasphingorhabdus sp. JC815 TaxID=3232140 RepID=UPI00345A13CA
MDNNNTIAGWVLAGAIAALGLSILSGKYFHADKHERPETMGFVIEGVESSGGSEEVPISVYLADADIAAGEAIFKKCVACHTIDQGGANGIGPNLYGALGKSHGHVAGFAYSDALTSISGNWDFENMDEWLTSPRKYAPGTKMTFAGLGKPEDRANLIAYMNTKGSNLPYPEPPVAEETAEGEAVEGEETADVAAEEVAEETVEADAAAAEE